MYIKKIYGYVLTEKDAIYINKGLLDTYSPQTTESENWKHWVTHIDGLMFVTYDHYETFYELI